LTTQKPPAARRRPATTVPPGEAPEDPQVPGDPEPDEDGSDDEVDVAIDLLEEDAMLREAIREPTTIRLPTGKVISVPHSADWPHLAARLASVSAYDAWAKAILSDRDFKAFQAAELRTYQVERIVEAAAAAGGITPGKPRRSSASRRGTARR
jgi:hypothetical protein